MTFIGNINDAIWIKGINNQGFKGIIKEVEDEKYKVTFFINDQRKTEWFNQEDLSEFRPIYKQNNKMPRNYTINCTIEDESLLPQYETICASGMDLRAYKYALSSTPQVEIEFNENGIQLYPLQRVLIKTGLRIELPPFIEAQIRPRSGLALKNGISIVNSPGTIDEDFRGNIGIILINLGDSPFTIKKGDKIAQMVFQRVQKYNLNPIVELSTTVRGEGGFGSTSVK